MAAGTLPKPGSALGPCEHETCRHIDCELTRSMAAAPCEICKQPIGYDTAFYRDTDSGLTTHLGTAGFAHARCIE